MKPQVGMIGLAVMGSNLARNIERNGYPCVVYNREPETTEAFISRFKGNFVATESLEQFVAELAQPRQIFMMIRAGAPVDSVIEQILPLLDAGDILIDGGNSYFKDTQRREQRCRERGVFFLGVGVSGGEEGALNGASIMPGGAREAWQVVAPLLEKIAAKAPDPCTGYVGPDGAGHFVKMVHNGIEYGDMQLIAEAYHVLRDLAGAQPEELSQLFSSWNDGPLSSFLIEITASIFRTRDDRSGGYLVDKILDKAGQKGTGMWTAQVALDLGVPVPTLVAAVEARSLSARKEERVEAAPLLPALPLDGVSIDRTALLREVHDALYGAKIIAYAQGMALLAAASREWNWQLDLGQIAAMWRGGCIIRARFLELIQAAYRDNSALPNLLLDAQVQDELRRALPGLRAIVARCAQRGLPVIAFTNSLAYYDSYRSAWLPQNLTQAQRDFFGAHTYLRADAPEEGPIHTDWQR